MSKKRNTFHFKIAVCSSICISLLLPNIFSITSSLEFSTLIGPVNLNGPPLSKDQIGLPYNLVHPVRSSPAPLDTTEIEKEIPPTREERELAFRKDIESPSLWSLSNQDDPRHIVVGCDSDYAWVWVWSTATHWGQSKRIGQVVTTNWEFDRLESLEFNDYLIEFWRLYQINPVEIETRIDKDDRESWSVFSECPNDNWEWKVAVEQQWGWPFRSMFSVLWLESAGVLYKPLKEYGQADNYPTYALLLGKKEPSGLLTDSRHLALGLLPFGLLGNFIIYTTVIWLVLTILTRLKHYFRLKKGRCPLCCYQLNAELSSGCPECGWLRNQQSG